MHADGTLGDKQVYDATGRGPFGFTFAKNGNLFTTEQFDGPAGPGRGAATSYILNTSEEQPLLRAAPSIQSGGTDDTCWFIVSDDQKLGFTTSFFGERVQEQRRWHAGVDRNTNAVPVG